MFQCIPYNGRMGKNLKDDFMKTNSTMCATLLINNYFVVVVLVTGTVSELRKMIKSNKQKKKKGRTGLAFLVTKKGKLHVFTDPRKKKKKKKTRRHRGTMSDLTRAMRLLSMKRKKRKRSS